jgi:cell division protein FtsB
MPYKKITFFTIIVILLLTINDLIHSIYTIWQKQDLIIQTQKNLTAEKNENQELKKEITQVNQPQFLETQARDKLLLTKPGESVVIMPRDELGASTEATPKQVDMRPNWKKWWDIFFNS